MSELKRCPFCGGDNVGIWRNHPVSPLIEESYEAHCYDCHFGLHPVGEREEAIKAWNTRKPMARIVEQLEEELHLSNKEKKRCVCEYPLQFDEAKGYARGIANAIEIVKEEGGLYEI